MVTIHTHKERAAEIMNKIISMLPMEFENGAIVVAKKIATYLAEECKTEAYNTHYNRPEYWQNIKNEIEKID